MPRSPSDATRFTATGPYISSHSSNAAPSSATNINFGASAPSNESPQQKIARLRAAAAAAKQGQESQFDQVVRIGRKWADRAHRVTAISLIGLTVVSAAVATAGISDMIIHNRRKRGEWLAEQQAKTARALAEARATQVAGGSLTEEQVLLINRERAAMEAEEARRNRPGIFKRATNWAFGGLSMDEQKGGRLRGNAPSNTTEKTYGEEPSGGVLQAVEERREESRTKVEKIEEAGRPLGGPLDWQAQSAADAISTTSRSWLSRITGK